MTTLVHDRRWSTADLVAATGVACERHVAVEPRCSLPDVLALARQLPDGEDVVAVGGGAVLDQAKLALLVTADGAPPELTRGRAGLVVLDGRPRARLAAVPTTLGTGSEANAKAVVEVAPGRRRLVVGDGLLPAAHRYVPSLYRTLPVRLRRHGALEVVLRLAALMAVTPPGEPWTRLGAALRRCADLVRLLDPAEPDADGALTAFAHLSASTHQLVPPGQGLRWGWPLWYLANELASLAGLSKMEATLALLPATMARLGRFGHGSAEVGPRLADALGADLLSFARELDPTPPEHVRAALRRVDPERVAEQALRQWGGPGLGLAGATRGDLVALYRKATSA